MALEPRVIAEAPVGPAGAGDQGRKVVAFTTDDDSATALCIGLLGLDEDVDVRRGNLRNAVRYFERESLATAAIVDISGVPDPQAALDDLARVCPSTVKVIVIGENTDIHFYRLLVNEIGVAEYIPKPLTRDTVQRVLLPLLTGDSAVDPSGSRGGHVVAVCGARGGVGATTIAVSTALQLAATTKGHVALLDLHLQDGATALILSGRPGPGLRIALEDPERADALFLDRTAIAIDDRLKLVAAEEAFNTAPSVTAAGVSRVIDLLRQRFNYVVVDLPMPPHRAMQRVLDLARHVVVVMEPDVASLRDARAIRSLIVESTGADRILMVLNRADTKGGLPKPLIRKGLDRDPDVTLPDYGRRMIQALNLGVPALHRVPALRRQLEPLIHEIAGTSNKRTKSWLGRFQRS